MQKYTMRTRKALIYKQETQRRKEEDEEELTFLSLL
jgi:hypothetical protein